MGCMCAECKFSKVIWDNRGRAIVVCICRESDRFAQRVDIVWDSCDFGKVDDQGAEEEDVK